MSDRTNDNERPRERGSPRRYRRRESFKVNGNGIKKTVFLYLLYLLVVPKPVI